METRPDAHAVMAATLANGGICPITGEQVFKERAWLKLMSAVGEKFSHSVGEALHHNDELNHFLCL